MAKPLTAYVGTYTETMHFADGSKLVGKGEGIYRLSLNPETGSLRQEEIIRNVKNPSYLKISPSGRFLYAANELGAQADGSGGGMVSAFAIQPSGGLRFLNAQPTQGDDPCYVETDGDEKTLFVANYSGGSFAVFDIEDDGSLKPLDALYQFQGKGTHPLRQTQANVHAVTIAPGERYIYVSDLGTDRVVIYGRADDGSLEELPERTLHTGPTDGPRHGLFPGNGKFYLVNELSCTVTVYDFDEASGALTEVQDLPALMEPFSGTKTSADIHATPDGRFLYVSTRGADRITLFTIETGTGRLCPAGEWPSGGKTPRNFAIDPTGAFLVAANQDSDVLIVFAIDPHSGALTQVGHLDLPSPVCIKFA